MKLQHLLLATLVSAAMPASAAVEASSGYWTGHGPQDFGVNHGNGLTASSGTSFIEPGVPPLPHISGAAGSTANGLLGRLSGGASVFSSVGGNQGPSDSSFFTSAAITDRLVWDGMTPLSFSIDVDWSLFGAQSAGPDYGVPGLTNVATVSMRFGYYVSYLHPVFGETMLARRSLVRTQFDHSDGSEEEFAIEHDNGIDTPVDVVGSSHWLAATVGALGFDPGTIDVVFTLGIDVGCGFVAGAVENHDPTCQAAADLTGTAYAAIRGSYSSLSGYTYTGRPAAEPPGGVPEPSALALAGAAIGALAWRRRRGTGHRRDAGGHRDVPRRRRASGSASGAARALVLMCLGAGSVSPAAATWLGLGDGVYTVTATCIASPVVSCATPVVGQITVQGDGLTAMDFSIDGQHFVGDPEDSEVSLFDQSALQMSPYQAFYLRLMKDDHDPFVAGDRAWYYCRHVGGGTCAPDTRGHWTAERLGDLPPGRVPEPATAGLAALALLALGARRQPSRREPGCAK